MAESGGFAHRGWRAAAFGLAVVGGLLAAVVAVDSGQGIGRAFPGFFVWENGTVAAFYGPGWSGPTAGLPSYAQIRAFDGRRFERSSDLYAHVASSTVGHEVLYEVAGSEGPQRHRVPTMTLSAGGYATTFGVYLLAGISLWGLAVAALLLRPDRPAARMTALAATAVGAVLLLSLDFLLGGRFGQLYLLVEAASPAALLAFGLTFPTSVRRRIWYATVLPVAALGIGLSVLEVTWFHAYPARVERLNAGVYALLGVATVAAVLRMLFAFRNSRSDASRLQLGVLLAALVGAMLPVGALLLASTLLGWNISFTWIVGLVPVVALSLFLAAVQTDVLGAERFIRLSVAYGAIVALALVAYAGFLAAAETIAVPIGAPVATFLFVIALTLMAEPIRRRVQAAIDRVFFRSTVEGAQLLETIGFELAHVADAGEIAARVGATLESALALESAALLRNDETPPARVVHRVPVRFGDEDLGVLVCGPKRSGAPFSQAERDVIRGAANQAALALQSARATRSLREAERLAAVGELAGAVAHGLRNPLAGIRIAAQLSLEDVEDGPVRASLEDVLSETDRLEARIRSLLDFSRRPFEAQLVHASLRDGVASVARGLAPLAREAGVSVVSRSDEGDDRVRMDPDMLDEALRELVGNALRVAPAGSEVRLWSGRVDGRPAVRVSDRGPGIPAAIQDRVFELFFTTRETGTGVGLATARRLIEAQGGQLALESSSADGTTFLVQLSRS